MALFRSIREHLVTLARSEQGMALPTAIFAMIASMGLASAAILSSVDVQQGSHRDSGSKKAIAAADAGASVALLRLNRYKNSLSVANPCIGPAGEAQTPVGGWCPVSEPETVGSATWSYTISAFEGEEKLSVISVGTAAGVSRRVEVGVSATPGENVFANEKVVAKGNVALGGAFLIESSVGTNGTVTTNGGGDICGNVRVGPGMNDGDVEPGCGGKVTEGEREVPEIVPPENISTVNSNCRLSWTCTVNPSKEKDLTCDKQNNCSKPAWNSTTRTLESGGNNTTLSLGGGDYFICRLLIKNGQVIMLDGAKTRIFFDTPENCGMKVGENAIRFELGSQAEIAASGYRPEEESYDVIGLYFLGSETIPTRINIQAQGGGDQAIIYAPQVDIEMNGGPEWVGMMAGKTIEIQGNPKIIADPHVEEPEIKIATLYARDRYFECVGATASPPDANC